MNFLANPINSNLMTAGKWKNSEKVGLKLNIQKTKIMASLHSK